MVQLVAPPPDYLQKPPHSIETEQSVIGGLLLSHGQAYDRIDWLPPEAFYSSQNREIYAAIAQMVERGRSVDALTVGQHMGANGETQAYIGSLALNTPSAANIVRYAEIVRDRWQLRQVITIATEAQDKAYQDRASGKEIAEHAEQSFLNVLSTSAGEEVSFEVAVKQAIADLEEPASRIIQTGLHNLDRKLAGGGFRGGQLIVIAGRPGMGKAQPLDAKVLLKAGTWRAMGELRLGDELASHDGKPSRVMGVYPQGERDIFTVTFSDGRHTRACAEHLWSVMYRDWDARRIIDTSSLSAMLGKARYRNRLSVEMVSGAFGGGELPLDPYVLGVLLGDGGLKERTPRLSSADPEIVAEVQAILGGEVELRKTGTYDYRLVSRSLPGRRVEAGCSLPYPRRYPDVYDNKLRHFYPRTVYPVRDALNELGLLGKGGESKFIPAAYLCASHEHRLSLLQGLMDTDGWAEVHGTVRFSSCSRELSVGVETLVRSLGGTCSIANKKAYCVSGGERRQGLDAWVCRIRHKNAETFFRLQRKSSRAVRGRNTTVCLNVSSVEPSGHEPAQCITVTHPSRLYVTDDYVVTHNSAFAFQIAEHVAQNETVAGFTLEMQVREVAKRALAYHEALTDRLHAARHLIDLKLRLDDTPAVTVGHIRLRCRRIQRKYGLSLVVVDYLQLMRGQGENRTQEVGSISRGLKALAKELDVPVILLSQLNRNVESRTDRRPIMADLRESGDIEQDADIILMLYRDEEYHDGSPWSGLCEVLIRKQRSGPTGTAVLSFRPEVTRFGDYSGPVPSHGPAPAKGGKVLAPDFNKRYGSD